MKVFILIVFILLTIFYIIDCVISAKLEREKQEEVKVLREQIETMDQIHMQVVSQRNKLYSEIKKFNDNVDKFNGPTYVDDGK